MDILIIALAVFFLLAAVVVFLLWRHLFFRDAFTPPTPASEIQVRSFDGIPFLIEHGLPYPAGILSSDRPVISLDGAWNFQIENASESTEVTIPSCFNTAGSPLRDFQGAVFYDRSFSLPGWPAGSRVRLTFLGSFYRTEAWLDGRPIGTHEGGYLPFYFDISHLVTPGQTHQLKVRVDNRIDATSLPQRLFQGHNPGWQPYGGLHRSVRVEILPPQYCFKLRADTETEAQGGVVRVAAVFHAPHEAQTPGAGPVLAAATVRLLSGNGQTLAEQDLPLQWDAAGQFGAVKGSFSLPTPRLWAPGSPHLYRLEIQTPYERCQADFGFRTIQAQAGKLLLNGAPLLLRGVCRHQEDRQTGLAQAPAAVEAELAAIQALNGNFVRLAHYPHSGETLDLCDRMGLCAWGEIPLYQTGLGVIRFLFDKTRHDTGKTWSALPAILRSTQEMENPAVLLKARGELLKMIERDCNHPSVLFWSLGNECWTFHPSGEKALAWLRREAEVLDRTRLFSYAAFALPYLGVRYERSFAVVDVASLNEYFGWYYGKVPETGPYLNDVAQKYHHKPLLVTETGADAVAGRHTDEVPPPRGYSEDYQAWLLQAQWAQMRQVPTFAGLSIWVLKDFLCPEYREDNPVPFYNLKGLLDRDGRPKKSFEQVKRMYGPEKPDLGEA